MVTVYKEVEIEVELDDYDDEDLIEECQRRNLTVYSNVDDLITKIWQLRRENKPFDAELDEYIYKVTGKAI